MKQITYRWMNGALRHIDDGQCDEIIIKLNRKRIVLQYGVSKRMIHEQFDLGGNEPLEHLFSFLLPFTHSQDFESFICDGSMESLRMDSVHLTSIAETPLSKQFLKMIQQLLGFDVLEYCMTRFKKFKLIQQEDIQSL